MNTHFPKDDKSFCSSKLFDSAYTWDTDDPDLSLCFEKTVLTWTPCFILWISTPLEILLISNSKCRDIPWRTINSLKLMGNIFLLAVSALSLARLAIKLKEDNIYQVDIWTSAIQTATYALSAVLLLWNRVRGRHTSGVLFIFWLLLAVGGAAQFRTELRLKNKWMSRESNLKFIFYMISYPVVVIMLILNLFPDPPPRDTNYPQSKKICPEVCASYASRVVFRWFDTLIWKGFKKPLTVADLWDLRFQDTAAQIIPSFGKYFFHPQMKSSENATAKNGKSQSHGSPSNSRNRARKPISVLGPTFKVLWISIVTGGITNLIAKMLPFVNSQILKIMIRFVDGNEYTWRGILYAVGMFVAAELQTILLHQSLMTMYVVGLNWRTALMSAIYRKALRMSNSARKKSTVGEVVNLMAVDAQRCADFAPFFHNTWTSITTIIVALYFLWQILGPSTLAGMAVMVIVLPINTFIANKVKFQQAKQMKHKDERVKLMNEILSGIKVLKMYAWEPSFRDYILRIREKELSLMWQSALLNASTSFVWGCSSFLVSLATFGVFVLFDERNVLTSEIAFVSVALFNIMSEVLYFYPMTIQMFVQCLVSIKRINKFLNAEELVLDSISHDESKKEPLIIEGGCFSWGTESTDAAVLQKITLRVKPGSLVAVVGPVGSGKSSLISAFLGEMDKITGYVNTKGSIAYVPQQAWIQNATVRDNILFGSSFDSKRYFKTIEVCSLKQDFEMLPAGDETEIGEKGINLSGGQKQRVSLARAVYNDADTYLLDDPLSAVDSHVGKHIFENVIGPKGVLSTKTRVMVTHGLTYLPQVDVIVVMNKGEIIETGSLKELLANKGEFSEYLIRHLTDCEDTELEAEFEDLISEQPELKIQVQRRLKKISSVWPASSRKASSGSSENIQILTSQIDRLIQAEKTETGSVKLSVYMHYLNSAGLFLSLATLGFQLLSQGLGIASNIWLSEWSSDSSAAVNGVQVKDKRDLYLEIYSAYGFGKMAAAVAGAYVLAFGTFLASRNLHLSMLSNILHCPMSFFDTTPTGRLVNRFGKDIDVIDNTLPATFSTALNGFGNVIGTMVVITWSTPLFAIVILPIGLLYYAVQKVYITTSRQLKRIESVSRSPVYSHFSETISGATSIRAYKVESRFIKTSEDRVDANQVCLYPSLVSNRWLGVRLETLGNALIFFAALFAVLDRASLHTGVIGLSLTYALQITNMLNIAVRMSSEVETNIVSVERIKEYSEVPTEAAWMLEPRPDPQWPSHGTIKFENYQVRYREGLNLVLKGVSCVVNGGEKIGIVGRTGAGKSSLTLCLFRILEAASGCIYIDGLDISKVGLGDLRSKLTIIPQEPVLFSGSLRMNLDPLKKYSDSDIWTALHHAHISDFAHSLGAGLNHTITEGGDNLSVGQQQLICLARALLNKTKVLILDEATAAIDLETDGLIQQTIRREFRDCTVLTIAHRLNTIMDSDRVIVLDKGVIKEFDSPGNLLGSASTIFYGMVKDAGLIQ